MTGPLALGDVRLSIGGERLLGPLNLIVAPGEIVTVMGPSGSGKSSLIAYLTGTLDPALRGSGRIRCGEIDVTELAPENRRIGVLFQDDLLFPHLSVSENLAFGLRHGESPSERRRLVEEALEEAGLRGFGPRDPATLSGGQRARAALMRTLLSQPRALLLDEPFAKLDMALRDRIRRFVFDHVRDRALPTLLVTHDPADAEAAGGIVLRIG